MWQWIFLAGFALAAALAGFLYSGTSWRQQAIDYWKKSYGEERDRRRKAETDLFTSLAGYCRADFFRRGLCAKVEAEDQGDDRVIRVRAAPADVEGESWSFSVTMPRRGYGVSPGYLSIEAWPGGERAYLFLRVEPGEAWHDRAARLVTYERRGPSGSHLPHELARLFIEAFFGQDRPPAVTWSLPLAPRPTQERFPSLDDPMDDMD